MSEEDEEKEYYASIDSISNGCFKWFMIGVAVAIVLIVIWKLL